MGLISFSCIPKPNDVHHLVRVVFPDGHIKNLSRSCSVDEILHGNPDCFVCGISAQSLTSRMGAHEQLERGFTYFIYSHPNALPFGDFPVKCSGSRASLAKDWKLSSIFSEAKENRSSHTHHGNLKVFDYHSAPSQVESRKAGLLHQQLLHHLEAPKHILLFFFRECLQSFRLPRPRSAMLYWPPPSDELPPPSPSPSPDEIERVHSVLQRAARIEVGVTITKRRELQRSRKRRKVQWRPWLQSIPENHAVVKFLLPVVAPPLQSEPEAEPKQFSPPRATGDISPRRRRPPRHVSPPRPVQATGQLPRACSAPSPQPRRKRKNVNGKPLYMA